MRPIRPARRSRTIDGPPGSLWEPLDPTSQAVAVAVLRRGPIARADLARRLQLSTPSLTRIVRQLMDSGIVVELPPAQLARTGRPSLPIAVDPDRAWFVGFKVVTHRVHAAVCDLSGAVQRTTSLPLPDTRPETVVDRVTQMVLEQRAASPQIMGSGIALAAVVDDGRTVRSARFLGWGEVDLADRIETSTGLPCVLDNDVRAFTVAEHWFGVGRGLSSFAVLTVGTGVGAGIVVHDELVAGSHGRSGMVGHLVVDPDGPPCYEDHRGCAFQVMGYAGLADRFSEVLGRRVEFEQGLSLAASEPGIEQVLRHASRCLGRLAGTVANLCDPERILLSGEGIGWVVRDALQVGLDETRFDGVRQAEVLTQQIDVFEWARGAAAGAIRRYVLD